MLPKKFIVYSLSFIVLMLFSIHPAFAQNLAPSPLPLPASIPPTSPLYTDLLVNNLFHSFSCLAIGQSVIEQPCLSYLKGVPVLTKVNTTGGALGATTSLIGMLYANPPVRTADYLASLGEGMGLIKKANAQVTGSGYQVLKPVMKLWLVSRNISYVIMIVIFVIIGLMIMFRNKLNPQTVITAQAALPGLVIGLIMITFSFFLAGLISDMAFVGTNVVGYYFAAARGKTEAPLTEALNNQNVVSVVSPMVEYLNRDTVTAAVGSVWGSFGGWTQFVLSALATFLTVNLTSQATAFLGAIPTVGNVFQAIVTGITATVASRIPDQVLGFSLAFIASIILIYALFKLLLRLINSYITIIFLTITAPFQLLFASLPGRQGIATGWILNMLANILAFPAVLAVLYFVAFLIGQPFLDEHCGQYKNGSLIKGTCPFKVSSLNQTDGNNLVYAADNDPIKITGSETFPLFGGLDLNAINLILAFGALVALPSIPDIIGRAVGRMGQAGQMIGQEIAGSVGAGRGYAGQFNQGVGGISGQAAKARALTGTTAWKPTGFDPNTGQVTGWEVNPYGSSAGGLTKAKAWWRQPGPWTNKLKFWKTVKPE